MCIVIIIYLCFVSIFYKTLVMIKIKKTLRKRKIFYLEKAYDTTWKHGILLDLYNIGPPFSLVYL